MRSAVVFYSLEGNTRAAASGLAERLGADLVEVRPTKAYPTKGLAKFFHGGKDSTFGRTPQIEPVDLDPSAYDLVVLALPMWAGKAAAPMNTFIQGRDFGGTKVALVVSSASGNADSCVADIAKKLGRDVGSLAALSLTDPKRMAPDELASDLDHFAARLQSSAGGAF